MLCKLLRCMVLFRYIYISYLHVSNLSDNGYCECGFEK